MRRFNANIQSETYSKYEPNSNSCDVQCVFQSINVKICKHEQIVIVNTNSLLLGSQHRKKHIVIKIMRKNVSCSLFM